MIDGRKADIFQRKINKIFPMCLTIRLILLYNNYISKVNLQINEFVEFLWKGRIVE